MIQKPNGSLSAIDVPWLGHFTLKPKQGPQNGHNICPVRNSETSGPIFGIQKSHESPLAIDMHWLSHFTLGPQQGPKKGHKEIMPPLGPTSCFRMQGVRTLSS